MGGSEPGRPAFPPGFRWGVSASAYQIEGAVAEGGRGPSTWDRFCAEPGRITDGNSGAIAADHYHRFAEDIALMRDLGVTDYRLSIAWPRILPEGRGTVNQPGLDFYERLVDALGEAGIAPMVTLYHWDTPQALEDQGGWTNRDMAGWFADYAGIVAARLADRVARWATLNEPMVLTNMGYAVGGHAPGRTLGLGALPVAHHQLLGHGRAVAALRATGASGIGIVNNQMPVWPASDDPADVAAANLYRTLTCWLYSDPVLLGRYPEAIGAVMPGPVEADLAEISAPIDWYGLNYYNAEKVGAPSETVRVVDGHAMPSDLPFDLVPIEGRATTDFGWPVTPEGLGEILAALRARYGPALPPIHITENGAAYSDEPGPDGAVWDGRRIDYHAAHLEVLAAAIAGGADVRGYFIWSILDNFEWAVGLSQRFGLVHVDYETLKRTPKASFAWYRDFIRAQRA
ncbi:beta-glucosidase [Sphingomonas kyeonggiensis]|uniref:Beta-glucosidase n=1 Tax=Sphingomonas kyeonggiensis TaxID=1268553 RepID=A0A7W7K429_9SPHN|nr:GH1 family beta-glucosidase [Sphingomonas kyeonggiensis]MBB4839980.1 beta-glucosidase [Sphingomonas kyeonggiensis]